MTRPVFSDIHPDAAERIASTAQDTAQKQQDLGKRDERFAKLQNRAANIMQTLQNLHQFFFGKKSEKIRMPATKGGAEQLSLFHKEDSGAIPQPDAPEADEVPWAVHKRKKKRTQKKLIARFSVSVKKGLLCSALCVLFLMPLGALGEARVMVVTDIHYLAPELYRDSDLFIMALKRGDGKITQYSDELLAALCSEAAALKPDALIVTGDLTLNGEKASHKRLAQWFASIEKEAGVPVWVIPGNHDINSENAHIYYHYSWDSTETVSQAEFAEIYRDFMLPAEGKENANLSYHVIISDEFWAVLPDISFYKPTAQAFGLFTSDHKDWIEGVLTQARAAGAEAVTFTHHNLISHTKFLEEVYLMFGHESMASLVRQYGVRLNLSGHMHIQHIAEENGLTDAVTGGFCVAPHRYSLVTLSDDGTLTYEAKALNEAYLPEGFQAMSRTWFGDIAKEKARASLSSLNIPVEALETMLDYFAKFNLAYFAGEYSADDPAWMEDAAYPLWQRYAPEYLNAYMGTVMHESQGNHLIRVLPPYNR